MPLSRKTHSIITLVVVAYFVIWYFTGYSATMLLANNLEVRNPAVNDGVEPVLVVGRPQALDACISDKGAGDMFYMVHECAGRHPMLFRWSQTGPGVVRVDPKTRQVVGEMPGRFTLQVRAAGHTARFNGVVIPPIDLRLSTYDTTMRVGGEFVVGTNVESPTQTTILPVTLGANLDSSDAVALRPLPWAYPPAARIRAVRPGVACVALAGYEKTISLRVDVQDSAGMPPGNHAQRCASPPGSPDRSTLDRAAPPGPAIADSVIAAGARMAFAYELCEWRWLGKEAQAWALSACEDSVATLAPEWNRGSRFGRDRSGFTVTFTRLLWGSQDDSRVITIDARRGTIQYSEQHTARPQRDGPAALLQGHELATLRAAAACDRAYRSARHRAPATFDELLRFAAGHASPACDDSMLHFDAGGTERVHESRSFTLAFTQGGTRSGIVVRPARWGITGVVSYRLDDSGRVWRTLENRAAGPGDELVAPDETPAR